MAITYNKYYFNFEKKLTEKHINEFKKISKSVPDLKFVVILPKKNIFANQKLNYEKSISLIQILQKNGILLENITFAYNAPEMQNLSNTEWNVIKKQEIFFKSTGINFGFEDFNKTWTLQDVENANAQIMRMAENIKNLSPFEKLLAAYDLVTSREYKNINENEHYSLSRSVYGVLNGDKIVCVGFQYLYNSIIQYTNDKNIKLYKNTVLIEFQRDKNKEFLLPGRSHRTIIVYLKDEKYNIEGYYLIDPTSDSNSYKSDTPIYHIKLTHFMLPLTDLPFMKNRIYHSLSELIKEPTVFKSYSNEQINSSSTAIKYNPEIDNSYGYELPLMKSLISIGAVHQYIIGEFVNDLNTYYPNFQIDKINNDDLSDIAQKTDSNDIRKFLNAHSNPISRDKILKALKIVLNNRVSLSEKEKNDIYNITKEINPAYNPYFFKEGATNAWSNSKQTNIEKNIK